MSGRNLMQTVLPWLVVGFFLVALLYLAAPTIANALLFYPAQAPLDAPPALAGVRGEVVDGPSEDGVRLRHWWYDAGPGRPAVVVLHGNAGHLGHRTHLAEGLLSRGISVLLVGYRGYGGSEGRPSESGLYRDGGSGLSVAAARAGGADRVVLLGRSLGAAVAAQVAAREPVAGLVLDAPFTSLLEMARAIYPFLPRVVLGRLVGRFDTVDRVGSVGAPVLVIHGTEDELIPFWMGLAVHEAATPPREWFPVPGAGHNDLLLVAGARYFDVVADFVHRSAGPHAPIEEERS